LGGKEVDDVSGDGTFDDYAIKDIRCTVSRGQNGTAIE
jgi:hypothetical protein